MRGDPGGEQRRGIWPVILGMLKFSPADQTIRGWSWKDDPWIQDSLLRGKVCTSVHLMNLDESWTFESSTHIHPAYIPGAQKPTILGNGWMCLDVFHPCLLGIHDLELYPTDSFSHFLIEMNVQRLQGTSHRLS